MFSNNKILNSFLTVTFLDHLYPVCGKHWGHNWLNDALNIFLIYS